MTDKERIAKLEGHISRLFAEHNKIDQLCVLTEKLTIHNYGKFKELEDRIAALEKGQD